MCVCCVCMLCVYACYICYVCSLCMYAMYECYVCMYVMYVCCVRMYLNVCMLCMLVGLRMYVMYVMCVCCVCMVRTYVMRVGKKSRCEIYVRALCIYVTYVRMNVCVGFFEICMSCCGCAICKHDIYVCMCIYVLYLCCVWRTCIYVRFVGMCVM